LAEWKESTWLRFVMTMMDTGYEVRDLWLRFLLRSSERALYAYQNIVACFVGNATRKFTWVSDLDDHSLRSQIQLFALVTSSDFSSSMLYNLAPLISVMCLLLGAQLSLALVGYELYWSPKSKSKSKSKSHCGWRSVSQSVSKSWCRATSGAHDQIFITLWQFRSCVYFYS
jgi:hypothetical protein